jgi:cyclopropane fatty-acyl-phospholipid synthase-like methyltransferase
LLAEGLNVYTIDASPTLTEAFRRNFPNIPVVREDVEESTFFDRTFDGVVASGLVLLFGRDAQRRLIRRVAEILVPGWPATFCVMCRC